jgi:hypothetical protein
MKIISMWMVGVVIFSLFVLSGSSVLGFSFDWTCNVFMSVLFVVAVVLGWKSTGFYSSAIIWAMTSMIIAFATTNHVNHQLAILFTFISTALFDGSFQEMQKGWEKDTLKSVGYGGPPVNRPFPIAFSLIIFLVAGVAVWALVTWWQEISSLFV